MNFRRLKYFVKIVDIGSLTQAAEVLHIAQPALSQQLATLEGELKQQLLIRTKRGVQPTEAGNILYAHAQTILRQCEQAQSAVNSAGQAMSGQVSLGLASGSTAAQLALPLLQSLRDQQPGILLSLHENGGAALAGQVANQTLDMAMVYGAKMPAGLHAIALMREDLYLVATRAVPHPGNSVELLDVARLNLFLPREGDAVRNQLEEAMALRKLAVNVVGEIESSGALSAAIAGGLGATVLPESVARAMIGPAKAWMARINAPTMSVPLSLCMSSQQALSAPALLVKDLLLSIAGGRSQEKRALALVR
ncbi:TPA: nitrogen assimilation transcriptional regulator NAC [Serratia marcescens]|uniref:nitrogen assimilation transcriptional regulator NAC n=1 Tax=Serratia marcescens TaxID=615 RepID=UPI0018D382DE|nr:nitrogen assimilation transcriptional regulator NAC [Serratia marcescens]MBH1899693.1 nitrogen assimilation transcriptional regulator NAC [Serratia marcescens]MBH2689871.1 nitrogen assimilation transcriptional regulator NAC [Serratia marcescens]MBH2737564.1 nitrogen assimilation transcriptional regulator NAC [Serratia marcescens]MBH2832553.1 nitrogen assimilation transcriptional regulator NAC [Serratia marcescens]MBH3223206.1 nitrogen assimilation transcriptional regulator NAC [Serratia mar